MAERWWHNLFKKLGAVSSGKPPRELIMKKDLGTSNDGLNFKLTIDLTREPTPNLGLPPEAVPGLSTIKELVRRLRYHSFEDLIGQKIEVSSIESAATEVGAMIEQYGIKIGPVESHFSEGTFMKHGLLDYSYPVLDSPVMAERQPVRFLKEIGLLLDRADVDDAIFPDAGLGFLEELLEQVRANQLLFKIVLDSEGEYRGTQGPYGDKWRELDPSQFFPCRFVVSDACLSNCSSIWLAKHFYL